MRRAPGSTKVRHRSSIGAPSTSMGARGLPAAAQARCAAAKRSSEAPSSASTRRTSYRSTGRPSAILHRNVSHSYPQYQHPHAFQPQAHNTVACQGRCLP